MSAPSRRAPDKEPEFVVDAVDDGQTLPPILHRHQLMMDDLAAVLRRYQLQLQLAPSLFWAEQHQEPPPNDVFVIKLPRIYL